jgi:hypothetical protein
MNNRTERRHTVHRHQRHIGWNNAQEPVLITCLGETIEFHPVDVKRALFSARR